uniref:Peroxidase n=1 Tax=Datisca glomerata TaxID=34297 RepID=A0A3Q8TMW4_DATGL|nr:peroxidase 60 [Datisca glomerata]
MLSKFAFAFVIIVLSLMGPCYGALQVGFYKGKCGFKDVESIVRNEVNAKLAKDSSNVPALLRLQFQDCFVTGCDASILLNGISSEKTAPQNLGVRGYDVIDAAKATIEKECPGLVSCADIISMATRDAISWAGGQQYEVETGRRDGFVSLAQNVNLPSPSISVSDSIAAFAKHNLTTTDMVYLLGAHTVGVTKCNIIQDNLYNFQSTGKPTSNMDPILLKQLQSQCPQASASNVTINLDQVTPDIIDKSYYRQIIARRGILQIDQQLALDPLTKHIVTRVSSEPDFLYKFGQAMVKLGKIQVLTGTEGEIRKTCGVVN